MFIVDAVNALIAESLALAGRGSQTRLAAALGVRTQTVSKWASGEMTPERHRWPDIERFLELDEGALMAAHRAALSRNDESIPAAVFEALQRLDGEIRALRGELGELRSEVDRLHGGRRRPARSSDPAPPAKRPTQK